MQAKNIIRICIGALLGLIIIITCGPGVQQPVAPVPQPVAPQTTTQESRADEEDKKAERKRRRQEDRAQMRPSSKKKTYNYRNLGRTSNVSCRKYGTDPDFLCHLDSDYICQSYCSKYFSGSDEKECLNYPVDLVFDFHEIIEALDDGEPENGADNHQALKCLLELNDRKFKSALKDLTKTQAEEYIEIITEDDELSNLFNDKDDDYDYLKILLGEIGGVTSGSGIIGSRQWDDVVDYFVDGDNTEDAFEWFDGFIEDELEDISSVHPLAFYCKYGIVTSQGQKTVKSVLLDRSSHFVDKYSGDLECKSSSSYNSYETGRTSDDCWIGHSQKSGSSATECELETAGHFVKFCEAIESSSNDLPTCTY